MFTLAWIKAAGIRALKTFSQVIIGMIAVGAAFDDVVWLRVLEVAVVAAVLSLLTSITGLPEVGSDGNFVVNTSNPTKDIYKLELNKPLEAISDKPILKLNVKK